MAVPKQVEKIEVREEQKVLDELFKKRDLKEMAEYAKKNAMIDIILAVNDNGSYKSVQKKLKDGKEEYEKNKARYPELQKEWKKAVDDFDVEKRKELSKEREKLLEKIKDYEEQQSVEQEYWIIAVGAWAAARLAWTPAAGSKEERELMSISGNPRIRELILQDTDKEVAKWINSLKRGHAVVTPVTFTQTEEVAERLKENENYTKLIADNTKLTKQISNLAAMIEFIDREIETAMSAMKKEIGVKKKKMFTAEDRKIIEASVKGKAVLNDAMRELYDNGVLTEKDSLSKQQVDAETKLEEAKWNLKEVKENITWFNLQAEILYRKAQLHIAVAKGRERLIKEEPAKADAHKRARDANELLAKEHLDTIRTMNRPKAAEESQFWFSLNSNTQSRQTETGTTQYSEYIMLGMHYRTPKRKLELDVYAGLGVYPTDTFMLKADLRRGEKEFSYQSEHAPGYDRKKFGVHGISWRPGIGKSFEFTNLHADYDKIRWGVDEFARDYWSRSAGDTFTRLYSFRKKLGETRREVGLNWAFGRGYWEKTPGKAEEVPVYAFGPALKILYGPKDKYAILSVQFEKMVDPYRGEVRGTSLSADFRNAPVAGAERPLSGTLKYFEGWEQVSGEQIRRLEVDLNLRFWAMPGFGGKKK